jgi:hypothetical protein
MSGDNKKALVIGSEVAESYLTTKAGYLFMCNPH